MINKECRLAKLVKIFVLSLAVGPLFLNPTVAHSFLSPVSVSIIPPVQFPPEDFSVTGARVSVLWGRHRDIYGIDLSAIGNFTNLTFVGLAASGVFNVTNGTTTILGLQAAGGANINTNKTTVIGLQLALGANINKAETTAAGFQVSPVNLSEHTTVYGAQVGVYNRARSVWGFQIGLVNSCENLHGLQVGLANFHKNGIFKISPILNLGF